MSWLALFGWAFALVLLWHLGSAFLGLPSLPTRRKRQVAPAPPPALAREEMWALDFPWLDSTLGVFVFPPDRDLLPVVPSGARPLPILPVLVPRTAVLLPIVSATAAAVAPAERLRLTLTTADVIHIAGVWQHSRDLPQGSRNYQLPSGRILSADELADFVRWLRDRTSARRATGVHLSHEGARGSRNRGSRDGLHQRTDRQEQP